VDYRGVVLLGFRLVGQNPPSVRIRVETSEFATRARRFHASDDTHQPRQFAACPAQPAADAWPEW
jgi:hypothetical protein